MLSIFKNIWAYRGFILGNVKREFQMKYHNSMLDSVWTVINPQAMTVYTAIFSQIMRVKLPDEESNFAYSVGVI